MGKMRVTPYKNNSKMAKADKWYMRPHYDRKIDAEELIEHIVMDSRIERSLVDVVVRAIVKQISEELCNGHPIQIPYLGIMKLGVTSEGADSPEEYNATKHITDLHISLTPDKEIKKALKKISFEKYVKD